VSEPALACIMLVSKKVSRGLYQLTHLLMARMHFIRGEYDVARALLDETMTTARLASDKTTLQQCIGCVQLVQIDGVAEDQVH